MIHYAVSDTPRPFLAAAFATQNALDEWLATVPEELRPPLDAHVAASRSFPAFLLETTSLSWVSEPELRAHLDRWATEERPEEWVFANLYCVVEPWQPRHPGTDAMGLIPHIHVETWHLRLFRQRGLAGLLESWLTAKTLRELDRAKS